MTLIQVFEILIVEVHFIYYHKGLSHMNFAFKKLAIIACFVSQTIYTQQPQLDTFIQAIEQYDTIVRTLDHIDKTYEELPQILGKISGVSLWFYGVYKGLRSGDMTKIAMATAAGVSFGFSVATAGKIVQETAHYCKWLYRLNNQEEKIRSIAHLNNLQAEDISQIEREKYSQQTIELLRNLQLELPI